MPARFRKMARSAALLLLLPAFPAAAAVYGVSDVGELRAALLAAAESTESDTVNLAAGTYALTTPLVFDPNGDPPAPNAVANANPGGLTLAGEAASSTVIEGDGTFPLLWINMPVTPNSFDVTVRGLTFRNGYNAVAPGVLAAGGGGANLDTWYGDVVVDNCIFEDNATTTHGGGLKVQTIGGASPITLKDTVFRRNHAVQDGGGAGLFAKAATLTVSGCRFEQNAAGDPEVASGGGLHAVAGTGKVYVDHNVFRSNTAGAAGGTLSRGGGLFTGSTLGISGADARAYVRGNLFAANRADSGGGFSVELFAGAAAAVHNTAVGNRAGQRAAGTEFRAYNGANGRIDVFNNVYFENRLAPGDAPADLYLDADGFGEDDWTPAEVSYNRYDAATFESTTNLAATANTDAAPGFASFEAEGDPATWELRLTEGSALVDAGSASAPLRPLFDFDGVYGSLDGDNDNVALPDMGAYEFRYPGRQLVVPETSLEFGTVTVGSSGGADLSLWNAGGADLTLTSLTVTGADADLFVVLPGVCAPPKVLATGEWCDLAVQFFPGAEGAFSASVEVGSDDPQRPVVAVALSGDGAPFPVVLAPASVEFGDLAVGGTSPVAWVYLENPTDQTFYPSAAEIAGADAADFAVDASGCEWEFAMGLGPYASCPLGLTFAPSSEGPKAATLTVRFGEGPTVGASLAGTGTVEDGDGDSGGGGGGGCFLGAVTGSR